LGSVLLFASNPEEKLFEKLFVTLFNKKPVYVLTSKPYLIEGSKVLIPVHSCKKADIILGYFDTHCKKPLFVLDYYVYKKDKNALGAFYWRKGRPQLRLREKIIKRYHLHISKDFEEYLE
jgi:hypothetical protein